MSATIRTNGHARPLTYWHALPESAQRALDYARPESDDDDSGYSERFFLYRGEWYDVQDFVRIESDANPSGMRSPFGHVVAADSPLARWDGIATESHWSGVVVRYATDWDGQPDSSHVVVGYYVAD